MDKNSALRWQDATIFLAGPDGDSTRSGKILGKTGLGYYVTSPYTPRYGPVHLASGYRCSADLFYSEEQCQQYLQELAALMNWNQPREQLIADPAYSPEKINEINKRHWIEDASVSAGGGQW